MSLHYAEAVRRGTLAAAETRLLEFRIPAAGRIKRVELYCEAANGSGDAIFDVNVGATVATLTTIFTDQTQRVRILAGQTSGIKDTIDYAVTRGQLCTIDLDTVPAGGITTPLYLILGIDDGAATPDGLISIATFVTTLYSGAFARDPTGLELSTAETALQTKCASSGAEFLAEARSRASVLFASAEYTARARTDSQFVADLYAAFLNRVADPSGHAGWLADTIADGRPATAARFATSDEFRFRVGRVCLSAIERADAASFRGRALSATAPTDGQGYVYHAASNLFLPTTPAAGGGGSDATSIGGRVVSTTQPRHGDALVFVESPAPANVTWASLTNAALDANNRQTKTDGANDWTAGATSTETFPSATAKYVEFRLGVNAVCGLGPGATTTTREEIAHYFWRTGDGSLCHIKEGASFLPGAEHYAV
ncbi:MAG: DUF4214 domain-containing protein, partial [Pyrinomonadaceae bacterium]|nr:DUF4214 domain-containing protein [Pyrinomonadaceae bacterium]